MKKPVHDCIELQLQEYNWQADAANARDIEWLTAGMAPPPDMESDDPEYRH